MNFYLFHINVTRYYQIYKYIKSDNYYKDGKSIDEIANITKKSKIVEEKEKELIKQQAQINEQKNMLSKIKNEVNNSKYQLNQKILDLKAKETEIELQKTIISQQTEKVEEAKKELSSLNIEIEEKQNELKDKENEIAEKEEQLDVKDTTIDTQKQWMIIGGIVLLIILILSISLAKMIKDRNKRNKELNEKNNEISNKNVEINTQKEELLSQKEYIETQLQQTQASIDYAQTIQNAILPRKIVMSEFFENIVLFRPKDIVSGDFYWFTHLPAKNGYSAKTFFATVDCTGHGVPGAFMSMIGNRLLNEIINEKKILDTAKILDALDAAIKKSLKQAITSNRDGMDMCICKIEELETKQYEVMYSGAKRPLYYYNSKENKLSKLAVDRKSIGGSIYRKSAKNKFTHKKIKVLANDIIYLTTDGYIDQNDLNRKRMGSIKFEAILSDIVTKTIQEQANILNHELDKHMQSAKQRDDITLLAIKF
jgi:serine phosphatase RsbU (regulator of sigma subunit)